MTRIDSSSEARAAATKPNYVRPIDHPGDVPRLAVAEAEAGAEITVELAGLRAYFDSLDSNTRAVEFRALEAQTTPAARRIVAALRA
jgi:hypothetical protein